MLEGSHPPMPSPTILTARVLLRALDDASVPATRARGVARLRSFEGLRPEVAAVDREAVRDWVHKRLKTALALSRRPEARVRHAALWALGESGDPRAVEGLVSALQRPQDEFDHDHVFMAVSRLGPTALPPLRAMASMGWVDAVSCLGHVRGDAVGALDALRAAYDAGVRSGEIYTALFNLHDPRGLDLALRGVAAEEPALRLNAVGAMHECVSLAAGQGRLADIAVDAVARALRPVVNDPRVWTEGDPGASTWVWCLETLAMLSIPDGRTMALRALSGASDRARRLHALLALSKYPADDEVLNALTPLIDAKEPELRGAAALALYLQGPPATRDRCAGVLLQRVLRPGLRDDDRELIVAALRDDDAQVEAWIRAGEQTADARVRGRVAEALRSRVCARDDREAELDALAARCGPSLAAALRRRMRQIR